MPVLLHAHLKRGLDYDQADTDPADLIERVPHTLVGPEEQAAKRQRVEKIASQYLRGRVPVLLTASLRGPFNAGWKNPWAEEKRSKRSSRGSGGARQKAGMGAQNGAKRAGSEARATRSASRAHGHAQTGESPQAAALPEAPVFAETIEDHQERHTPAVAQRRSRSPEVSRAAGTGGEDLQESHTLDAVEPLPATAPSPEPTSSTANFVGPETARCVRSRSPMTNPFWLRRPEPDVKFDMRKSTNGSAEASPSHARGSVPQPDRRRTLQLAQPKAALGHRARQRSVSPANNVCSSASTSMIISSPAKAVSQLVDTADSHTLRPHETPASTIGPAPSTFENAQLRSAPVTMPSGTLRTSPGTAAAEPATRPEASHTSQQGGQMSIAREAIQRSAERLVDLLDSPPRSATLSKQANGNALRETNEGTRGAARPQIQHNFVASPAPNCSSGFVYKKVGTKKWTIDNAPRSKPRAVNFNSSQGSKKVVQSEPSSQTSKKGEAIECEEHAEEAAQAREEQQSMGSTRSSRLSAMSTQAAMLLAQLEFQESTFPMSPLAVDTPRPWSQPQEEIPRTALPEPSPAITPISVFKPQLDQSHATTSVLHGPMMSTQDLFAAASPFAMSTVKKKPAAPERSNLRMSITSLASPKDDANDQPSRSPILFHTGISLAEENAAPSPWSFGYDNGQRKSRYSPKEHLGRSIGDVGLPQLDLHTSLDGYGTNGSIHFADQILRNFNET